MVCYCICVTEPLHTTEDSSNAGIADCSDQSKQVLHYAQSAMVVETLNKQVSFCSIVTVHVGKGFVTLGNIVCTVALIFNYQKTLQMFRYWNGGGGVRIILLHK